MKLLIARRRLKFLTRLCGSGNGLCKLLADAALLECVAVHNLISQDDVHVQALRLCLGLVNLYLCMFNF